MIEVHLGRNTRIVLLTVNVAKELQRHGPLNGHVRFFYQSDANWSATHPHRNVPCGICLTTSQSFEDDVVYTHPDLIPFVGEFVEVMVQDNSLAVSRRKSI